MRYNLIGKKFGRLKVIKLANYCKRSQRYWVCVCRCGKQKDVSTTSLRSGKISSCGCKAKESFKRTRKIKTNLDGTWYKRFTRFIYAANKRGHATEISGRFFKIISNKSCFYCGGFSPNGINGLDRRNNNIGYIKNNVVPCCKMCNLSKSNNTEKDFLMWIERVYMFQIKKSYPETLSPNSQ